MRFTASRALVVEHRGQGHGARSDLRILLDHELLGEAGAVLTERDARARVALGASRRHVRARWVVLTLEVLLAVVAVAGAMLAVRLFREPRWSLELIAVVGCVLPFMAGMLIHAWQGARSALRAQLADGDGSRVLEALLERGVIERVASSSVEPR